eukprot:688863-Amphidinium_carterae.1
MLSVPKQQSHKIKLPTAFEGNKQNGQQGPTTTFKNWAAEVHIYMSLEDHNLATMLEDVKTEKVATTKPWNIPHKNLILNKNPLFVVPTKMSSFLAEIVEEGVPDF